MKKNFIKRALVGFPIGMAIGQTIAIIISLIFANGYYSPCPPALVENLGSEIGAVVVQTLLSGLIGAIYCGSSVVWDNQTWSLSKQTALYFLILSLTMFPIAYFSYWMQHTFWGFISYFSIFVTIFILVWLVQHFIWKAQVATLNRLKHEAQQTE